jgi:hypothetical protein
MEHAVFDDPRELAKSRVVCAELQPPARRIPEDLHRFHAGDTPGRYARPYVQLGEPCGIARADGIDAPIPRAVRRGCARWVRLDEGHGNVRSLERKSKARPDEPAAHDDYIERFHCRRRTHRKARSLRFRHTRRQLNR